MNPVQHLRPSDFQGTSEQRSESERRTMVAKESLIAAREERETLTGKPNPKPLEAATFRSHLVKG